MEDLEVQVHFNEEYKTVFEEIHEILSKYMFEYATKQIKDKIKLDIEAYFYRKFGHENIPNNFKVVFDEDTSELSIVPVDKETLDFWKELGLL